MTMFTSAEGLWLDLVTFLQPLTVSKGNYFYTRSRIILLMLSTLKYLTRFIPLLRKE